MMLDINQSDLPQQEIVRHLDIEHWRKVMRRTPLTLGEETIVRDERDLEIERRLATVMILPKEIPVTNATQQIGNLGGLICGLIQSDYGLISRSIHDVIAEPRRQKLIPDFYKAKREAMAAGALGVSISGAGPSVFALCEGEEVARRAGDAISGVFSAVPLENQIYVSKINPRGVHVVEEK